jgi:hypothetical protein
MLLLAGLMLGSVQSWSQKKTTPQKKAPPKKTTTPAAQTKKKGGTIPLEQIESYRQQATSIIKFFESTLNFLGDKRNPVKEKQVIVTESYLKFCWDSEVQVEDDLDLNRLVPLFKDMPAYLSDVDFFFRGVKFTYSVQDISVQSNEFGQTYFKVTANRNLSGMTINGDSVKSNLVRYIEINYDDSKQQLRRWMRRATLGNGGTASPKDGNPFSARIFPPMIIFRWHRSDFTTIQRPSQEVRR